jgi:hypothetical protein
VLAVYRKKVLSRRTFTSSSFFNLSRWCESVEFGISNSDWISPTTKPSGCAESSNCIIRRRGSVPIAESMSANFATCSVLFLVEVTGIFRSLQKYGFVSSGIRDSLPTALCMPCCCSLRNVNVLYKERVKDIFFRPAAWIIPFPPAIRSSRGQLRAQLRTNTQSLGSSGSLTDRSGRFGDAIHQPATLPLRCCSGKHTWVLDRTPHLPCSLQGWSQCGMQCEIVPGNTVSISRKREVTDVDE